MENISFEFVYFSYKNILKSLEVIISFTMIIFVNERLIGSSEFLKILVLENLGIIIYCTEKNYRNTAKRE